MSHGNASLTPTGRLRLARCVVDDGWPLRRVAERFGVSVTTAQRWSALLLSVGLAGTASRAVLSDTPLDARFKSTTRGEACPDNGSAIGMRSGLQNDPRRPRTDAGIRLGEITTGRATDHRHGQHGDGEQRRGDDKRQGAVDDGPLIPAHVGAGVMSVERHTFLDRITGSRADLQQLAQSSLSRALGVQTGTGPD